MNEDGTKARGIIAIIVSAALVLLCVMLLVYPPPERSEKILLLVVGALIAYCSDVKQFYFGTSSGAKEMRKQLQDIAAGAATPTPAGTPDDPVSVKEVDIATDPGEAALQKALDDLRSTRNVKK